MTAGEHNKKVSDARLRHLARHLHQLGERAVYEYVREIVNGRDPMMRLEAFAAIDPAVLAALGGVALPRVLYVVEPL